MTRPATAEEREPCGCVRDRSGKVHTNWQPSYPTADGSRCKLFWCRGCRTWRPWCEGGAPDPRCDHCVTQGAEVTRAEIHHRARLRWLSQLAFRLGWPRVGGTLASAIEYPSVAYARCDREWAARIRAGGEPGAHVAALLLESAADETEALFRALARRAP